MAKEDEKDGVWRTVGGRRIFIAKGQSLSEAMKESGKFKNNKLRGPSDPKIKKANKASDRFDKERAKSYEKDKDLRKVIRNKQKLKSRLKKMKESGEFRDILGEPRDTKFGDKEIKNLKDFETTRDAMNSIAKQLNETKDPKQKADLERVLKNYTKNLREYQEKVESEYNGELHGNSEKPGYSKEQKQELLSETFAKYPDISPEDEDYLNSLDYEDLKKELKNRGWYSDDNSLQKSMNSLERIDRLANEAQHYTNDFNQSGLEKKGREMGSKEFEEYVNELRSKSWKERNDYKSGDILEYDTNHLGVNPRWNRGKVLSVEGGLAGHGDPNPDRVYKVKDLETGREYKIDASAIGKRIKSSDNVSLPKRFKEGFEIQNSKYSDESKMSLVEDGSGLRLIYDGKDTGTVMRNDLSESEIWRLRDSGKIQNMSEYLEKLDSLELEKESIKANEAWNTAESIDERITATTRRREIAKAKTKADYENQLKKIDKIEGDGTYDLETGKSKSYNDGYQVTFSMTNMDFDDKTYQGLVEKFKAHDHGTVDAGKYEGSPEISFNVTDIKKAAKLATKYNQISIWDWKNNKPIFTKGTGEFSDYQPLTAQTISKSVARTRGIQNRILNYDDEIKSLRRKSNLSFSDKQKILKLQREKEKLEKQLK